jgi:hypothetical protein
MDSFHGEFQRVSPAGFGVRAEIPVGWFVVSYRWVEDRTARRKSHGKWHRITSEYGSVYRILRYSVNLKGSASGAEGDMVLDWMGWIDLWGRDEDVDRRLALVVRGAHWWELPLCGLTHPDPSYRLATVLAVLSVVLGIVSVFLTFF